MDSLGSSRHSFVAYIIIKSDTVETSRPALSSAVRGPSCDPDQIVKKADAIPLLMNAFAEQVQDLNYKLFPLALKRVRDRNVIAQRLRILRQVSIGQRRYHEPCPSEPGSPFLFVLAVFSAVDGHPDLALARQNFRNGYVH